MAAPVYVLGGYQTDFARNWTKENKHIVAMMREAVRGGLEATGVDPKRRRGRSRRQLRRRALRDAGAPRRLPGRHRSGFSACPPRVTRPPAPRAASPSSPPRRRSKPGGTICAMVVGVEQMKTVDRQARRRLPRHGRLVRARGQGHRVSLSQALRPPRRRVRQALRPEGRAPRAHLGGQLLERQAQPTGADAQLVHDRGPRLRHATSSTRVIGGRIKVSDCSQVTDGAVVAVPRLGEGRRGLRASSAASRWTAIPRILGWGHHTAPIEFDDQGRREQGQPVRAAAHAPGDPRRVQARRRRRRLGRRRRSRRTTASRPRSTWPSTTSASPSPASRGRRSRTASSRWAASCRSIRAAGSSAAGHPVGATGVRQVLDAYRQVTGQRGRLPGRRRARRIATLNIGGSGTTSVCFVVGN